MKILKPGKVEMRKFVCDKCRCVFVADSNDVHSIREGFKDFRNICLCPTCGENLVWDNGEPYEEPTQDDRERLDGLICDLFNREPISRECIVDYLIQHGVTFREG